MQLQADARRARFGWIAGAVAMVLFIFGNSLATGEQSGALSGGVLELVNRVLGGVGLSVSGLLLRKLAHFSEFALLGLCLAGAVRAVTGSLPRHWTAPLLFGLLAAVTDETIQKFVPGRSSQVTDVLIDFAGVLLGVGVMLAAGSLRGKRGGIRPAQDRGKP